ncbi:MULTISPECIES: phage tail tape measure protein [unclassified Pseudomonas]|uniref:phage tail tape measure protein n=1 Tax=unclassified Pseudomonas TaxID=196821 RepID=UPI002446BCEF|nr:MULTISPECIES: phage tail tape measure protein [unclassified Pseudomonas]MDH0894681.1 phage tail tape measure protein [Pseudomonas sp. GD03875]MDH1067269.1 phage tail tape measure protein [Pseudomonas sp. GD03985]
MASDLKLQVILAGVDRLTRPLRTITQSSVGLGRELKETRDRLKQLQAQQNDVSSWRTLHAASRQTEAGLQAARDRVKSLNQEMAATGVPTRQMQRDLRGAIREAAALKREHQQQQTQLQGLRNKLDAAGISTRNLVRDERDLRQRIDQTNQQISEQGRRMQRLTAQTKRLALARAQYDKTQQLAGNMAGAGAGAAAAGTAMGMPVLASVKSYIEFEDAMLGVAKQVEGARDDNGQLTATYHQIAASIKELAERIPMATTEIAALVEGAARMGVQGKENLLIFAEVAANAATAFELPADEIGENLARIADLYKVPIAQVDKLGDAINYLDDNAKSKGADIIEVMTRLSDVSDKLDYKTAAALGSTFLTIGRQAETAASASRAMVRELSVATMQSKKFQGGMKMLGLDSGVVQKRMSTDAMGTIIDVLERMKKIDPDKQQEVATRLFGKEFGKDAAALTHNLDELRRQLGLVNSAAGDGSMQREADIRAAALSARLLMAQNRAFNLASALGETLRPTLIELIEGINGVLASVNDWVKANPELAGQLVKIIAGVAALAAVFGAVTLALASFLGPFAMVRYALTLFGIKSLGAIAAIKGVGGALLWAGKALLWIGRALMLNPIGLAVTAIAVSVYLIYKYWEPIKAYFLGLWAEIKAGFNGGLAGIAELILNFSPQGLFYRAFAGVMSLFGVEMPAKFSDFGKLLIQGLIDGIKAMVPALKQAALDAANDGFASLREKLDFIPAVGALNAGTKLVQQFRREDEQLRPPPVFDNRPPLTPRAPSTTNIGPTTIQIHAAPGMDTNALARLVDQKLEEHRRKIAARGRSGLSDQE